MTRNEFNALPHVPEEIQAKCNGYLRAIPAYKDTDFTKNSYRLVVKNGVVGILVNITSIHELRFCPMDKLV